MGAEWIEWSSKAFPTFGLRQPCWLELPCTAFDTLLRRLCDSRDHTASKWLRVRKDLTADSCDSGATVSDAIRE